MKYFHEIKITNNRSVYLKELTFDDYKNLQKICIEEDLNLFYKYLHKLVENLSVEPVSDLNLIDMFLICMSIRGGSIDNKKVLYTYVDGNKHKMSIDIASIVKKVYNTYKKLQLNSVVEIDNFMIQSVFLTPIDPENCIEYFILNNGTKMDFCQDIYDNLPVKIKSQVDKHIDEYLSEYKNLELFRITDKDNRTFVVNFDIEFENVVGILQLIIKDDLSSLYKNIFDMKTKMNISLSEHEYMTYNEYILYIKMFNKEQEEMENEHGSNSRDSGLPIQHN